MELPIDNRPDMADFTAARDVTIVSKCGAMCAAFKAGETRRIRKELFTPAIDAGLVPEESLVTLKEPEAPVKKTQEATVQEGLIEVCKTLIAKGISADFTMNGIPRAASVKN